MFFNGQLSLHTRVKSVFYLTGLSLASFIFYTPAHSSVNWVKKFDITPGICVIDESDSRCFREFLFDWELFQAEDICLYDNENESPLYCAESSVSGQINLKLKVPLNNEFKLSSNQDQNRQIRKRVTIQELGKDVRKVRKRLWSVF